MIEENAVTGEETVSLPVVDSRPIGVQLGATVRTARPEWGGFPLRGFHDFAVHLAAGGLIKLGFDTRFPYGFQQTHRAQSSNVARILRDLEAHQDVALRSEMIDLVGLKPIKKPHQACRI